MKNGRYLTILFIVGAFLASYANEMPALSDRAELLRVHLGWTLPESSTNGIDRLPIVGSGTNDLSEGISFWKESRFDKQSDTLSLGITKEPESYSGYIVLFGSQEESMRNLLEAMTLNNLPISVILDKSVSLPDVGTACMAKRSLHEGNSPTNTCWESVHSLMNSVQIHVYSDSPGTNIVTVSKALCDWIEEECTNSASSTE